MGRARSFVESRFRPDDVHWKNLVALATTSGSSGVDMGNSQIRSSSKFDRIGKSSIGKAARCPDPGLPIEDQSLRPRRNSGLRLDRQVERSGRDQSVRFDRTDMPELFDCSARATLAKFFLTQPAGGAATSGGSVMAQSLASNPTGSAVRAHIALDALPLVGRVFISGVFFISGFGKITGPAATMGFITSVGLPFPQLGLAIAILVETIVIGALVIGYRTRIAAAILVAYCFATAAFFHNHWSDMNMMIHFWKNMAMAGGLMQIIAFGGGRFSLDARRK
jgi:putative oxidoreductase